TAKRRHISAFAHPLIEGAGKLLGKPLPDSPSATCRGQIEQTVVLADGWQRVEGWLLDEEGGVPSQVLLLDEQGQVAGYALSGKRRSDLRKVYGRDARYAGFVGYLKEGVVPAQIAGLQPACLLRPGS